MNTPTSLLHVTARRTTLCLYATKPSESIEPVPVEENAIGPVQSIFLFCDRGGNGLTAKHIDHSRAFNHKTFIINILNIGV